LSLRSSSTAQLQTLTVAELREKLLKFGEKPPSKLRKAELISLLVPYIGEDFSASENPQTSVSSPRTQIDFIHLREEEVKSMTIPQLKEALKMRGLRVGGTKAELIERLLASKSAQSVSDGDQSHEHSTEPVEDKFAESVAVAQNGQDLSNPCLFVCSIVLINA
jgi:hypothetical protein